MNSVIITAPEGPPGRLLCKRAKARGYRVVVVTLVPCVQESVLRRILITEACWIEGLVDEVIEARTIDELCVAVRDEGPFVAVVAGSEYGVETANALASYLGLRGNPIASGIFCRHKFEMKKALALAHVPFARGMDCVSLDEAIRFVHENLSYPVYAKPPKGAGTQHVYRCQDESALRARFPEILGQPDGYGQLATSVIVEESIAGDEWAVNLFGDARGVFVTSVWRYEKISNRFADNLYWNDILVDPETCATALIDCAKRAYLAVGLEWGPAHVELRLSPNGPVVLEIAARMMGDSHEVFTDAGMCVDVGDASLSVFATGCDALPLTPCLHDVLACVQLPFVSSGRVKAIRGLAEIQALPTFYSSEIWVQVGDVISPSHNLDESPCCIWLRAPQGVSLVDDLNFVHQTFKLEVAE